MINPLIDIESLSIQQKLIIMEQLWNSLSSQIDDDASFAWHLDVLEERAEKTDFVDLDQAKANLVRLLNNEN